MIAPTGTIGLVMAADTTGVEPQFSLVQYKQLAGGGTLRIINKGVPSALKRLGYSEGDVTSIVEHIMGTGRLSGCPGLDSGLLQEKGFTDEVIDKIESSMPDVFDIRSSFSPSVLGTDFCTNVLGLSEKECGDVFFDTLSHIGLSAEQIEEANDVVFGSVSYTHLTLPTIYSV